MVLEEEIIQSYQAGIRQYFPGQNPYIIVNVLILSWAENDLNPKKEIESLSQLFRDVFQYKVACFEIPGDGTQADRLDDQLRSSVRQLDKDALLIIYYAGHCDKDEKEHVRWAAFEKGGPTLSWHIAQQSLFNATCDVLLLLDCCNAALIATGVKESGKFEMIAACAKNSRTVAPSSRSFTRVLIKELASHANLGIYASKLADRIRESDRITETPIFHDFVGKTPTGIMLKKIPEVIPEGYGKKPSGYMVMLVSLSDDPRGQDIADWLKTAAPDQVMGVNIEALILKAHHLEGLNGSVFTSGSVLDGLSDTAKYEINKKLRALHRTMDSASKEATQGALEGDRSQAEKYLEEIHASTEAVHEALETSVPQDVTLRYHKVAHQQPCIVATDEKDAVVLLQAVAEKNNFEDGYEIRRGDLELEDDQSSLKLGKMGDKTVVVEIFSYTDDDSPPQMLHRVNRITRLLSGMKQEGFHVLPYLGYFHDKVRHQFGLVFEFPPRRNPYFGLARLYSCFSTARIVALSHQLGLGHALASAIEIFQAIPRHPTMSNTKTYIVSPNFTLSPNSLQLGDILVDPLSPNLDPVNRRCRLPIDKDDLKDISRWERFSSTRSELLSGRFGLWTTFLSLLGVPFGADTGLFLERNSKDVIIAPELQTHEFFVTDEYVKNVLAQDGVKNYMKRRNYRVPIYMVSGLKIAKGGASINPDVATKINGGAVVTELEGVVGAKPLFQYIRNRTEGVSFGSKTDFILGFRVERIVFEGDNFKDHKLSTVGASMLDGNERIQDASPLRFKREGDISWTIATEQAEGDEFGIIESKDEVGDVKWFVMHHKNGVGSRC
ncbi:hypothetical protein F4803DRAFT_22314 [Xylaria telfairii]|nr:hypothetical protein F4803DRAFT_22314 [Xylaria telfairii]